MPKTFVTKPEKIEALRFDGTTQSAKEISQWVKSSVGVAYHSTNLREGEEKWGFARNHPDAINPAKTLSIRTRTWDFDMSNGDWLVHREDSTWNMVSDDYMTRRYDEVKDEPSADI